MATLEEMCKSRGKALAENYGLTAKSTKGTESMHDKMDYSARGNKKEDSQEERKVK